jgi:cytochrome P450
VAVTSPTLDLLDPAFRRDPYPAFRALHEVGEVHRDRRLGVFHVVGREAAGAVLGDSATYASGLRQPGERTMYGAPTMIFSDPPDHGALRRAFAPFVAPSAVREALSAIEEPLTVLRRPPAGPFDVMEAVCRPLPVLAICHILGLEPEAWRPLEEASNRVVNVSGGPDGARLRRQGAADLQAAFAAFVDERRAGPARCPADEEVVRLVARLDAPTVAAGAMLLLIAGHETTAGLLGNMIHLIATQPELLELARTAPRGLVEEALRLVGPVLALRRITTCDTELASVPIPAGATVVVLPAAANRDPRAYASPDMASLERADEPTPIAFGYGNHHCLGARLARFEAEAVLAALASAPSHLELAEPEVHYVPSAFVRRPARLVLRARP